MIEIQPKDSRAYFMLPQAPEDAGYYVYGKIDGRPSHGAFQYAPPSMITAIMRIEREWQALDNRKFGVGDISLAGGPANKEHKSHRTGLEVDIRPLRKDGLELPVTWSQHEYDHHSTLRLIGLFRAFAPVELIYFNDPEMPFVLKQAKHDNHFHVKLRG